MTLHVAILSGFLASAHPSTGDVQEQYLRWERRLRAKVSELHLIPASAAGIPACDVTIGFAISADGRPADPTIRQSSCKAYYDRAALRLVKQLGRIGRVPSIAGNSHAVSLKLSYGVAPTAAADRQLSDALAAERLEHEGRNRKMVSTPVPASIAQR